jgi:hypothetical protein
MVSRRIRLVGWMGEVKQGDQRRDAANGEGNKASHHTIGLIRATLSGRSINGGQQGLHRRFFALA